MSFSRPFTESFTRMPNVFFDEILMTKGITINEIKLICYVIRNTIGYNDLSGWMRISRSKILQGTTLSYGSINPTIQNCVDKGLLLEFKQGPKGKVERFLFLNTPQNEQLVKDLLNQSVNIYDLEQELRTSKYKNKKPTKMKLTFTIFQQDKTTNLEQVSCTSPEQVTSTKIEQVTCTQSEQAYIDETSEDKACNLPLKTNNYKNNVKKQKIKIQQQHKSDSIYQKHKKEIVVVQNQILDLFKVKFEEKKVMTLIKLALKEKADLTYMIQNTFEYHTKMHSCHNIFGSIIYAIQSGGWDIYETKVNFKDKYEGLPRSVIQQMEEKANLKVKVKEEPSAESLATQKRIKEKLTLMREQQRLKQAQRGLLP